VSIQNCIENTRIETELYTYHQHTITDIYRGYSVVVEFSVDVVGLFGVFSGVGGLELMKTVFDNYKWFSHLCYPVFQYPK